MLADIHKHLGVDGEIDADFILDAIHGDSWGLKWRYDSLLSSEDPSDDVVRETADILSMWRVIDSGVAALSPADRKVVEDTAGAYAMTFEGFDGNADPHMGVMRFLVEKLGRFDERAKGPFNSHSSMSLPRYRDMLHRYNRVIEKGRHTLAKDDLLEILKG
jgi:uncharacterized protein YfbU (UPF0304 family)